MLFSHLLRLDRSRQRENNRRRTIFPKVVRFRRQTAPAVIEREAGEDGLRRPVRLLDR
jgi:hypothetical protein